VYVCVLECACAPDSTAVHTLHLRLRVCVLVCVCVREREREKERERVCVSVQESVCVVGCAYASGDTVVHTLCV